MRFEVSPNTLEWFLQDACTKFGFCLTREQSEAVRGKGFDSDIALCRAIVEMEGLDADVHYAHVEDLLNQFRKLLREKR